LHNAAGTLYFWKMSAVFYEDSFAGVRMAHRTRVQPLLGRWSKH